MVLFSKVFSAFVCDDRSRFIFSLLLRLIVRYNNMLANFSWEFYIYCQSEIAWDNFEVELFPPTFFKQTFEKDFILWSKKKLVQRWSSCEIFRSQIFDHFFSHLFILILEKVDTGWTNKVIEISNFGGRVASMFSPLIQFQNIIISEKRYRKQNVL